MRNGFSSINCQKSCQMPTEIFIFLKYHCTILSVDLELDVSVPIYKFLPTKTASNGLPSQTLYFEPDNLSQTDVKR